MARKQGLSLGDIFSDPETFRKVALRVLFGISIPIMLGFTAHWSANGLGLFTGNATMQSFGYFFAFIVILLEWYFNQGYTDNKTMIVLSVLAYVYSIWTSFVGLAGTTDVNILLATPGKSIFYLLVAAAMDIAPETLVMFVLFGEDGLRTSDMLGAFLDLVIPGDQSSWWTPRSRKSAPKRTPARQKSRPQPARSKKRNPQPMSQNASTTSAPSGAPTPQEIQALKDRLRRAK